MPADFSSIIIGALSGQTLPAIWHLIPEGVKNRCGQGFDRLTGKITRNWDQKNKKENADLDNLIKQSENNSETRRQVFQNLVPEIAKYISGDPEHMERAIVEAMGDAYRKQNNKDAVAQEALIDVSEKYKESTSSNEEIDEDWLNIFSSYAEKASSTRTQQLWGKILSGEIRNPGKFSLSTLRILSEIDQNTAKNFVELSNIIINGVILLSEGNKKNKFSDLLSMQYSGIIIGVDSMLGINLKKTPEDDYVILSDDLYIKIKSESQNELMLPSMSLTNPGRELYTIIDINKSIDKLSLNMYEYLIDQPTIKSFNIYRVIAEKDGSIQYNNTPLKSWSK